MSLSSAGLLAIYESEVSKVLCMYGERTTSTGEADSVPELLKTEEYIAQ
jgi:hypothetical protein